MKQDTPKQFIPKRKMYPSPDGKIVWFLTARQALVAALNGYTTAKA